MGKSEQVLFSALCIVYLVLTVLAFLSNGRVILLSISERCPELDSLTFVLVTSLCFNQLFTSFFTFPCKLHSVPSSLVQAVQLYMVCFSNKLLGDRQELATAKVMVLVWSSGLLIPLHSLHSSHRDPTSRHDCHKVSSISTTGGP